MGEIKGSVRSQYRMFCLEESIDSDSEVRFIDAFVDSMDLEQLGFTLRACKPTGRNGYSSSSLVKLYIYGYYNGIRSSRRLAKACRINLELKWLIREVNPSYKTISEFRRENVEGLSRIFDYQMNSLRLQDEFKEETTIAVDGTRLHGQNSRAQNFNKEKLNQLISRAEKQIGQYLKELDQVDQQELDDHDQNTKQEKLAKLKENATKNKKRLEQLQAIEDNQISCTDPDSRRMARLRESAIVGYNGQIATTKQRKLIVASDVKNKPDTNTLAHMAKQAQSNMGRKNLAVLADSGFSESQQLYECDQAGLTTYVPIKGEPYAKTKGDFAKSKFIYDEQKDSYLCPNNKELHSSGNWYVRKTKGRKQKRYRDYTILNNGCANCAFRNKCQTPKEIKNNKPKQIRKYEYEEYRQKSNQRTKVDTTSYKDRKAMVEHPFGTLKRSMGFTYFLLKGLKKVNTEFRLICSCYNIKRLINIYGVKQLIKGLKALFLVFWRNLIASTTLEPLNIKSAT